MTGEQFHDALTLLPADLIAQADEIRCRKPKILPWKRYAAIAACLAVLLCSAVLFRNTRQESVTTEMAVSFSAMREETAEDAGAPRIEAAQGVSPNAAADTAIAFICVETPYRPNAAAIDCTASILTSQSELDDYFTEMSHYYQLDTLQDACGVYDESWFASNDLLLIPADGVSGSCTVSDVSCQDGKCAVTLFISEDSAAEPTNYRAVIPLEKDAVSAPANITIIYNSDTIP